MKSFKGYVLLVLGGLVVAAAAVFLALQWGNHAAVTMYGPVKQVNTAALIICSAVGGVIIMWACKLLVHGIGILRRRPGP